MNITKKEYLREEDFFNENNLSEVTIAGYIQFKNYKIYDREILASEPLNENLRFNPTQILDETISIGRQFYNLLEDKIKTNYHEQKKKNKDTIVLTNILFAYTKDNSIINNFIPYEIINDIELKEKIDNIIMKYCRKNGLPIVDNIPSNFDENPSVDVYSCSIRPFIALSVIIYIIFEIQNAIRQIIDNKDNSKSVGIISDMLPSDNDYSSIIKEYTDTLKKFSWLYTTEDIYKLDLKKLAKYLTNTMCSIQKDTTYLHFETSPYFYSTYNRFSYLETHNSILSIAWEKLKVLMTSLGENENKFTHVCKNCKKLFDTKYNSKHYCDDCSDLNHCFNSKKYYEKLKILHAQLCDLYNSSNTIQAPSIIEIKKIVKMKITEVKKSSSVTELKKYIKELKK